MIGSFERDLSIGPGSSFIVGLPYRPQSALFVANVNNTSAFSIGVGDGSFKHCAYDSDAAQALTYRNTAADVLLSFGASAYVGGQATIHQSGFVMDWSFSQALNGIVNVFFLTYKDDFCAVPSRSIVFMGDSITQFWPFTCFGKSANKGVAGQETSEMLARFNDDVISLHPDEVVILGGTNDTTRHENAQITNVQSMAEASIIAGIKPILCKIPPPPVAIQLTPAVVWNSDIAALAQSLNVPCVDYYNAMMSGDARNESLFNSPADTHPNQLGYQVMWDSLVSLL